MAAAAGVLGKRAGWRRTAWGEYSSEFLGTFVLIAFGDGVVAMAVAALNGSGRARTPTTIFDASGDWLLIVFGWAVAVALAVWVAGGISGAHINPAVTLALALKRDFEWRKVPGYMIAQLLGAFVAAALIYINYKNAINAFDAASKATRGQPNSVASYSIFATFPAGYFKSWAGPFFDQVIGTAFLVGIVFALIDEFNQPPESNLAPAIVGLVVAGIGLSFGANAGYAINPARDLGPRLWAWIEGWGKIAVPGDYGNVNSYMWIPIVGPFVGGVIGAYVYDFFIRDNLIARGELPTPGAEPRGETVEDTGQAGYVQPRGRTVEEK
jgi:glycerol uptake facilitator protein